MISRVKIEQELKGSTDGDGPLMVASRTYEVELTTPDGTEWVLRTDEARDLARVLEMAAEAAGDPDEC